jgi:molybdenum cofactor cytidylyltransferase
MKLCEAFNVVPGDVVSLIGAGGKTSTLLALGRELAEVGWRVLATTTTPIDGAQLGIMPEALSIHSGAEVISSALGMHGFAFVCDRVSSGTVYPPGQRAISWLLDSVDADALLIESDDARGLPFKAPYDHEPIIPPETTLVIPTASLSVLGKPLNEEHVYNARAMIERYGFYEDMPVKSPWVAQVMRDEELGLRGVPDKARVMVWLNGSPSAGYLRARARLIARLILRSPRVYGVAIGSARSSDPVQEVQRSVGAIVLAAGMSKRMGQPKVLMPWSNDKPILEHILDQLILARVDHIVVVSGHRAAEVRKIAAKLGVEVAHNEDYATGEMLSSVKAGLRAMPDHIAAALIALGDQPRIQPRVISQVLTTYAEGAHEIVAPSYQRRRGHPILIDRRHWAELLALPADGAPRDVINAHADRIAYVNVDTDSVLSDVDTPQEYAQERLRAGLSD